MEQLRAQDRSAPRIFLSYGQRDAGPLAAAIRRHLVGHGFDVFQDVDRLRAGVAWSEEIRSGIRSSNVFLALLSPHAVRRAGLTGNPDNKDSVCLDEIAYAVDQCQTPVIPVLAATCEPPFRIFRLQYLDFRGWEESEAHRASLLQQLRSEIERVCAAKRSRAREWGWLPEPLSFESFLAERRRGFTGRAWMLSQIEDWRLRGSGPALLVIGGPGTGKSAIVSELVYTNPDGQVLAYHCCQADRGDTVDAAKFVRSIAGMLAARLEGYAAMLENRDLQHALSEDETVRDPASAFEAGVLNALHELPAPARTQYLLIDALDEALTTSSATTIVELLATRLRRLPDWLKIVATTRYDPAALARLKGLPALTIDVNDPRNSEDLAEFIRRRLAEPPLQRRAAQAGKPPRDLEALLLKAGGGTFLIVQQILEAIERGHLDVDGVEQLPPGLGSLYLEFFKRIFEKSGADFAPARTVLQVIASALAPVTRTDLSLLTGFDEESELPPILRRLASFLPQREGRYRIFHKSLIDWLTGWDKATDQPEAGDYYISLTKGHERWALHLRPLWPVSNHAHPLGPAVLHCMPAHLAGAGRWDDLAAVLLDWTFLEAKASRAVGVYDLSADFALAAERMPSAHPEAHRISLMGEILRLDAQFIATHPDTLFQCCWNRGWWHDSPQAAHFYVEPKDGWRAPGPPWARPGPKVSAFMEQWRVGRMSRDPGCAWLRSLRPAPEQLGAAQRIVLHGPCDMKSIDVSPDGLRLVSGDDLNGLAVWDARTGAMIVSKDLPEDSGSLVAVRFRPHSGAVVAATNDGCLRCFDDNTLEETHRFKVTSHAVSSMAVTTDGAFAAVGDEDGQIHLCDLGELSLVHSVRRHVGEVRCMAFSSRRRLVSCDAGSVDGGSAVRVWTIDGTIEPLTEFECENAGGVCFTLDGDSIIWSNGAGRIEVRSLSSGADCSVAITVDTPLGAIAALPDGERVLCATDFAHLAQPAPIFLFNLQTKTIERTFHGHAFSVADLAVLPGARQFVSAGDSTIRIWNLTKHSDEIELIPTEPEVSGVAFGPAAVVYTCSDSSPTALARSLESGTIRTGFGPHEGGVRGMVLSQDGERLACGAADGGLTIWRTQDGLPERFVPLAGCPLRPLAFSCSGGLVAAANDIGGEVYVFDVPKRRGQLELPHSGFRAHHAAFSADDRLLATAAWGSFHVWDVETGERVSTLETHGTMYDSAICFVDDGEAIVLQEVFELTAWNARTGKPIPFRAEHRAAFERAMNRGAGKWHWQGDDHPSGVPLQPNMLGLVHSGTRQPLAWWPVMRGEMHWHPSGRTWANRRAHLLSVFTLEGPVQE